MATDVRISTGLQVGEWVHFCTNQDLSKAPIAQQEIYQPNQRFLVISREDRTFDPCRCFLVDIAGKIYDYIPRTNRLEEANGRECAELLMKGEIRAVSKDSVESMHGAEKVQAAYSAAQTHFRELAGYFAEYPGAKILGR